MPSRAAGKGSNDLMRCRLARPLLATDKQFRLVVSLWEANVGGHSLDPTAQQISTWLPFIEHCYFDFRSLCEPSRVLDRRAKPSPQLFSRSASRAGQRETG